MDWKFSEAYVLRHLHNLLDGKAERFYWDKVSSDFSNFGKEKACFIRICNGVSMQNLIRLFLQGVLFRGIVENISCAISEVLEKLRETMLKFAPLGPTSFCTEKVKVEYLYISMVLVQLGANTSCTTLLPRTALEFSPAVHNPWHIIATSTENVCNIHVASAGATNTLVEEAGNIRSSVKKSWIVTLKVYVQQNVTWTTRERLFRATVPQLR